MYRQDFRLRHTIGRCGRDDEKAVDITFTQDRQIGQACHHQYRNANKSQALCVFRRNAFIAMFTVVFAGPGHEVFQTRRPTIAMT